MNILKKFCAHKSRRGVTIALISAFIALVSAFIVSLCVGAVHISASSIFKIIFEGERSTDFQIFYHVRLPRTIAACLAGIALSLSGLILQTVLNNPMCSPSIIGVNAGAGLFMIIIMALFPAAIGLSPIAAFIGALFATLTVYFIAKKTGTSKLNIVLAGIAVSGLFAALTDTVITLVPESQGGRIDFLIGSFNGVTMKNVAFCFAYVIIGALVSFILSADINVLALGDTTASSLGLRVTLVRTICLILAAILAASAISLGGLIGFVGLIVPHISKYLVGHNHKILLPLTAMLGGAFCLICDILSRVLFIPYEIPVGIIMSLIGSPFFIFLIIKRS